THTLACDAIGFGHGLRAETQLADLLGCAFDYDALDQAWLPTRDAAGRTSVRGVYIAGDGASILGADAAELSGARAALAALEDRKIPTPPDHAQQLEQATRPHRTFRRALETAFAPPPHWAAEAPDELLVCRCEEVSAGTLRACVRETGTRELNRLKALTRIGMGRCQGRLCAPAAARLLADAAGRALHEVGRLRGQAPVKPLPIALRFEQPATMPVVVPQEADDD
ncbi:MAG TPA: (2Fe-2S)-binding protein, partial [Burkholderiaceae bacterium]